MSKVMIEKILMEEDVIASINENFELLIKIIPELQNIVGFDHKHPHHHLDVWEHTLLALSMSQKEIKIRLVLLLHDIGKPFSYQEGAVRHFKGHPLVSSIMAIDILTRLNYSEKEVEDISSLIKDHDNLIFESDIINSPDYCKEKFKVQFCDALAHNPEKLEKRIEYLLKINDKVNTEEEKEKYKKILTNVKKELKVNRDRHK